MRDLDLQLTLEHTHRTASMEGWDFSRLHGRLESDTEPWDFEADSLNALKDLRQPTHLQHAADLGTGGGERLIRLVENLGESERKQLTISATEGWDPNVRVARDNLRPLGIPVLYYDAEARDNLPFSDASLGLIMARHEAIEAHEIARALAPGGLILTQQVSGDDAPELREWFGGEQQYPHVTLGEFLRDFEAAGLVVEVAETWEGAMRFVNAQALVEYMAYVPCDVPGFEVAQHMDKLQDLDQRRPIEVTQRRFRIYAHKA